MDGAIRDTNPTEEFVKVIKDFEIPMEKVFIESITTEHYFSNTSTVSRVHSYLIIAYKYAGNEINAKIYHFMNSAVYACIIEWFTNLTGVI